MEDKEILKTIIDERKGQAERPSYDKLTAQEKKDVDKIREEYINFLNHGRTTHEVIKRVLEKAKKNNFTDNPKLKKFYVINDDHSAIALVVRGKKPIGKGMTFLGSHADFCSLHLKDHPIKEDNYLGVRLDTRPYGGFWNHHYGDTDVTVIGRFIKNGKTHEFEFPGVIFEPTIHISNEFADKPYKEIFKGEVNDITIGCRTKKDFLDYVSKLAGTTMEEKDFARGDFYAVPRFAATALPGNELITAYGHDDRSSVYGIYEALLRSSPTYTTVCFAFDREEIGSTGLTGAIGSFFEHVLDHILETEGKMSEADIRTILRHSRMISADVDIALNHRNLELSDPDNSAKPGRGMVICRVNGSKGQGGGNRAPAFLMDYMMTLLEKEKVVYQISSIPSKIEQGGGGTIARYFAERGVPTIDSGAPVSGMHGKRSILHIGDLYQCMKGFKAFMERE